MSDAAAFVQALHRASPSPFAGRGVHLSALSRHAEQALGAAARLQAYRDHLARLRAFKAARAPGAPGGAQAVDRLARAEGRAAAVDADQLCRSAVPILRALRHGDALDTFTATAVRTLRDAGPQRLTDLWAQVGASAERQALLKTVGMSQPLLDATDQALGDADARVTATDSRLIVEGVVGGRRVRGEIETTPRPLHSMGVVELLTRGAIDPSADALERGEPAYLQGGLAARGPVRPDEALMLGLLTTQREIQRHARCLEDAGLATHDGGEPGTVALILAIAGIVAIIAAAVAGHYCDPDEPQESACILDKLLVFIGLALLAGANNQFQTTSPGSPVLHAILQRLETATWPTAAPA